MKPYIGTGWKSPVKVDTLRLGLCIDFSGDGARWVEEARIRADEARSAGPTDEEAALIDTHGGTIVRAGQVLINGVLCEARRGHGFYMVTLATGDWSADISCKMMAASDQKAPGMMVTLRSTALAERGLVAVERFIKWASAFGIVRQTKVSRLDLAMDVASSEPTAQWVVRDQLVTKAVTSRVHNEPEDELAGQAAPALLLGWRGMVWPESDASAAELYGTEWIRERRSLSSINVGSRGRASVYLRCYDKPRQARKMHIDHVFTEWVKQGAPCDNFGRLILGVRNGAKDWGTIWRVEFECGREWLQARGIDSYEDIVRVGIAALWSLLTTKWIRVVQDERGTGVDGRGRETGVSRREARDVVPFWAVVQSGAQAPVSPEWDPFIGPRLSELRHPELVTQAPRASDQLKAGAAGTLATLFAGRGYSMDEAAEALLAVGMEALKRVPEKLTRVSIDGQRKLRTDPVTGALELEPNQSVLIESIVRQGQNPDADDPF